MTESENTTIDVELAAQKKESSRTLILLIVGILFYFIIVSIPVLIFCSDRLRGELGLLVGSVIAACMTLHMNAVIQKSLYMERHQSAFITWNSVGRLVVVAGILILAALTEWVNPITVVIGIFGLKVSAYTQPVLVRSKK